MGFQVRIGYDFTDLGRHDLHPRIDSLKIIIGEPL